MRGGCGIRGYGSAGLQLWAFGLRVHFGREASGLGDWV